MKQTWRSALIAARNSPRCEARSRRSGSACRSPAMSNGRCRMHGGKSPSGKKHGRYKNGFHTKESKNLWLSFRDLMRQAKALEKQVNDLLP